MPYIKIVWFCILIRFYRVQKHKQRQYTISRKMIQNDPLQALQLMHTNHINPSNKLITKLIKIKSRINLERNRIQVFTQSRIIYNNQNYFSQQRLSKNVLQTNLDARGNLYLMQEDDFLNQQANLDPKRNWVRIAENFNKAFQGALRSPKQCRERYINHSNKNSQNQRIGQWDNQSISILFSLYEKYGPKWTFIAQIMQNRSENVVKNKFYCGLRKFIRKLNNFLKFNNNKYKKEIKYESIIRILDALQCFVDLPQPLKKWNADIRKKIIELTLKSIKQQQFELNQINQLTENINKFNLQTRSYKAKKPRICSTQQAIQNLNLPVELQNKFNQKGILISTKQNQKSESKCQNTEPQKSEHIKNEKYFEEQSHEIQDKNILSSQYLSADEIFEDFGVSLQKQDYQKCHRSSGDILDQMFPETITFLNLQSLE